jgi:transposase
MSDPPSRDEVAARLEAAEARTETRFAQLHGDLDLRFADLGHKMDQMVDSMNRLTSAVQEGKADNKTTRITIVIAVVASVLAGIAAIWITEGDLLAAFQASITMHPPSAQTSSPAR